jgi:hypothetical protein
MRPLPSRPQGQGAVLRRCAVEAGSACTASEESAGSASSAVGVVSRVGVASAVGVVSPVGVASAVGVVGAINAADAVGVVGGVRVAGAVGSVADADPVALEADDVSQLQLAPASPIDLAVDGNQAVGDDLFDVSAGVEETSELQELAEANIVPADGNIFNRGRTRHPPMLAARPDTRFEPATKR